MIDSEICERENGSAWLIHPDYQGQVTSDWFDPEYWENSAQAVSSGGRGGAWFISADSCQLVLREYRRGGLAAKFFQKAYAFTREHNVRSFSEFRLLNRLAAMGLPVPRAVAAWYRKTFPLQYYAAIIVERIEEAQPLADILEDLADSDWRRLGQTIRGFHDAGVRHADLNCFNVLVKGDTFYLIDFDKGRLMSPGSPESWKRGNLERFARSLKKVSGTVATQQVWHSFMKGYNGSHTV